MGALRGVLAVAGIRRLQAAWFGGVSAIYGALVAVSVYAFAESGAATLAFAPPLPTGDARPDDELMNVKPNNEARGDRSIAVTAVPVNPGRP
jgi:hypothetical protein